MTGDERQPSHASRHSEHSTTSRESTSIHVQVPENVQPGEKFFVVVDGMEYEVWAPEDSSPGEMVAMEIYSSPAESRLALQASRERSQGRATTKTSEASVASDASLVYVEVPEGCREGETFFTEVNGMEYEILVPKGSSAGDLIYLEVPSKRTMGKFVAPDSTTDSMPSVVKHLEEGEARGYVTDICVPAGAASGQNFMAIINGNEFEVPVPEGYGPGDMISLQLPSSQSMKDFAASELKEVRMQLELVRQELQQVKEVQEAQVRPRNESKSSGDSNFIEILIPADCHEGDPFVVEVDNAEFQMVVPQGCRGGERIYMDLREGSGTVTDLTEQQKSSSRPASAVRKGAKEEKSYMTPRSAESAQETMEIVIPEDCYPGDIFIIEVKGVELELSVPAGCLPGELIYVDLPREGSSAAVSRPISAERKQSEHVVRSKEDPSSSEDMETFEIIIPEGCETGDVFFVEVRGMELELSVPEGCLPGELIFVDLPREGSRSTLSQEKELSENKENIEPLTEPLTAELFNEKEAELAAREAELAAREAAQAAQAAREALEREKAAEAAREEIEALEAATEEERLREERGQELISVFSGQVSALLADAVDEALRRTEPETEVKAPSRSASVSRSREGSHSASTSSYSIHVQVPTGVLPGERFFVVVDEVEYEVWAPEGCTPGEMVAMDIYPESADIVAMSKDTLQVLAVPQAVPQAERAEHQEPEAPEEQAQPELPEAQREELEARDAKKEPERAQSVSEVSEGDSVAADAILVPVEIPDGCSSGETFFAEVNGMEYEILVPKGCRSGHLIYLEIPAKHAIGRFAADTDSQPIVPAITGKEKDGEEFVAEVCIPEGAQPGQNFVAIIDGTEFEVPVPEGFGPGDTLSLGMPSQGDTDTASALQEVWEELGKMREELRAVRAQRERLAVRAPSKSSTGDSGFIEIVIPEDCNAGDAFVVEVDTQEYEMVVPQGCLPGEVIYMDMREASPSRPARHAHPTQKQKSGSRPASGAHKKEPGSKEILEFTIPEDCHEGDVFIIEVKGDELEMTVPEGCGPGDSILMDLMGGEVVNSRPASAVKKPLPAALPPLERSRATQAPDATRDAAAQTETPPATRRAPEATEAPEAAQSSEVQPSEALELQDEDAEAVETQREEPLAPTGDYRLAISVLGAAGLKAEADPFCACRVVGRDVEFETATQSERVNPDWDFEHVMEAYPAGEPLLFEVIGEDAVEIGRAELSPEQCFHGLDKCLDLGGGASLHVRLQNLGSAAMHAEQLEALRVEEERREAECAAMADAEAEERQRLEEEESRAARLAQEAAEEAERQRKEREEVERLQREEEEREAAKEAAKKAKEEAERQRLEFLKQQALEEAERAVREEEARIKREEAEIKGKIVISLTVLNDETEELMAKASLRLSCKVAELAQVCIREARLSVAPAIYSERKPEPKMVKGKLELRERYPLSPDDSLLEAGVENNAELRAKISPAVITASKDCTARIWNAETGSCELVLQGHNEAVCSACISPDCRYVATSSEDSSARLWYVDSGRCARVLLDHKEAVYSAAFSPDSKQVVTASEDGTAKIWVVKTGLCKLTLKGHSFAVLWAAFSPDGRSVTTTSSDGTLKIWNAKSGVCDRTLLKQKPVYLASFATDGSTFVTTGGDSTAKICDLVTGESKLILTGHESLVLGASYAPSCPQDQLQEKDGEAMS